jgi:hypothetical protein
MLYPHLFALLWRIPTARITRSISIPLIFATHRQYQDLSNQRRNADSSHIPRQSHRTAIRNKGRENG